MSEKSKPLFQMMVGLSGSGKSYYAEQSGRPVYSSDALRAELYNDINDQTHNIEVFEELHKRILAALKRGEDCVYDATNLSSKRRMAFLKSLEHIDCYKICTVIATPFGACVVNDKQRSRSVGYNVIAKQLKQFEMPHITEGWDTIHIVHRQQELNVDLCKHFEPAKELEHDSPYHKESIQQHMRMAANLAMAAGEEQYFYEALLFHDIGKLYTKSFRDSKGRPCDIAHFYNHENVSAYMYLTSVNFRCLEALYLIQYHMMTYKGEKAWKKFKNRFGDEFTEELKRFSSYDDKGRCVDED